MSDKINKEITVADAFKLQGRALTPEEITYANAFFSKYQIPESEIPPLPPIEVREHVQSLYQKFIDWFRSQSEENANAFFQKIGLEGQPWIVKMPMQCSNIFVHVDNTGLKQRMMEFISTELEPIDLEKYFNLVLN